MPNRPLRRTPCFITHWNSYFDGLIFSNFPESYPLASFLYTVVVQRDMSLLSMEQIRELSLVDDRTIRCAQIFIALIPIMLIYPFAQKYFVKGMTVGSVKGARSHCFMGKCRERRKKVTVKVRSSYGNGAKAAEMRLHTGRRIL